MTARPTIEILLATQARVSLDFLKQIFPRDLPKDVAVLVINQRATVEVSSTHPQVRVINTSESGLSRSRNLALAEARGKYCLLTDDDVQFTADFAAQITRGFAHFSESTVIQFCYASAPGKLAKTYPASPKRDLSWGELMNVSSIEIAIHLERFRKCDVQFNPYFGLGSQHFKMGEEQIFLADLKRCGAEIDFYPAVLTTHDRPSTAQKLTLHDRYYVAGAVFSAIFGQKSKRWTGLKLAYDLKQCKVKWTQVSAAWQAAKLGQNHYLNLNDEHSKRR